MLQTLYRKLIPIGIRYKIAQIRSKKENRKLFRYWKNRYISGDYKEEYAVELDYLIQQGEIMTFPYQWAAEYVDYPVEVYRDPACGLSYVIHKDKKLYFPKHYSQRFIKRYYQSLLEEQAPRSPHFYFDNNKVDFQSKTFIDVGAAEGIVALDIVEQVKQVVMFECNRDWQEALCKTFEPWKEKVRIVPMFVGNENSVDSVRLDDWAETELDKTSHLVLKLDVEGSEKSVLEGAKDILNDRVDIIYVCTYHRPDDYGEISAVLKKYNYELEASEGYMFYGNAAEAGFRKGLIRGYR